MGSNQVAGYVKSENVIWFVAAALLIGFVSGVAFGIYKVGATAGTPTQGMAPVVDEAQEQVIDELEARTRETPGNPDTWIQLGHQYFDMGRSEAAVIAYEKALAIDDRNADVWTDLGVMYRRTGNPEKAIEAFDKAIAIDPRHEISRFNKGIVLFHDLKDQKGALAAWESLLAINPQAKTPGGQSVRDLIAHLKANPQDKS